MEVKLLDITTKDDLKEVEKKIIEKINQLGSKEEKRFLRSSEVLELLNISASSLQNLRVNGILPFTKLGGSIYYDRNQIYKILDDNEAGNNRQ